MCVGLTAVARSAVQSSLIVHRSRFDAGKQHSKSGEVLEHTPGIGRTNRRSMRSNPRRVVPMDSMQDLCPPVATAVQLVLGPDAFCEASRRGIAAPDHSVLVLVMNTLD